MERWYVLAVLALGNFAQCLCWFTYSSIEERKVCDYYRGAVFAADITPEEVESQIHLLLNWGAICGVLGFPAQCWLIAQRGGLRRTVLVGLALVAGGTLLRLAPTCAAAATLTHRPGGAVAVLGSRALSLACVHAAQILNAFAGPFFMGSASRLAVVWFPERERVAATAVASTANAAGVTIGFLLGPWLVPRAQDLPALLYVVAAVACAPCCCAAVYFPDAPRRPPSAAAAAWAGPLAAPPTFSEGLRLVLTNRSYGRLVLAAGILAGSGAAWQGVFHDSLPQDYSDAFIGWLGFANSAGTNVGAVVTGWLAGRSAALRRRFRATIVGGLLLMATFGVAWTLLCAREGAPGVLVLLCATMGVGNGVADPLFYELGAELTYPAPEGTSAGVLVLIMNITALVMLLLPANFGKAMNGIFVGLVLVCTLLVLSVPERRLRPADEDQGAQRGLPSEVACSGSAGVYQQS